MGSRSNGMQSRTGHYGIQPLLGSIPGQPHPPVLRVQQLAGHHFRRRVTLEKIQLFESFACRALALILREWLSLLSYLPCRASNQVL